MASKSNQGTSSSQSLFGPSKDLEKNSHVSNTETKPNDSEDTKMALPTLKRKATVIFSPLPANSNSNNHQSTPKKGSNLTPDSPVPNTLISPLSPVSSASSTSTVILNKKPAIHYFLYEPRSLRVDREMGTNEHEVTLIGFNDDAMVDYFDKNEPMTFYKVPHLFTPNTDDLPNHEDKNRREISVYLQEIEDAIAKRREAGNTNPARKPMVDEPRQTLGVLCTAKDDEYFIVGPDDLVILECGFQERETIPWNHSSAALWPFAHPKHFERTELKHFAFEWIRWTDKIPYAPPSAVNGVHIWLVDYTIRRRTRHRNDPIAADRFVFYGPGVRFIEVRREDDEWRADTGPESALLMCQIWREHQEMDRHWNNSMRRSYNWPTFGVLACVFDD